MHSVLKCLTKTVVLFWEIILLLLKRKVFATFLSNIHLGREVGKIKRWTNAFVDLVFLLGLLMPYNQQGLGTAINM